MFPKLHPRLTAGVLLATSLAALAAGCGSNDDKGSSSTGASSSGKGAKIALLLPENKTARYENQDKPFFEAKVKELCPGCQVIYSNATQDAAKQQQQAEAALTQGAKVLVLDAVDVASAGAIVTRAKQQHVPVLSYGRLVANAPLDYYVSIDPYKVGQQQAQEQLKALQAAGKSNPRIIMINGSPTDSNSAPYKKGAESVYKEGGATIVKSYDTPDWSPDKAQQEMEQAITSVGKGKFDAVYVANDGMAGGAIAAMKSAGLKPGQFFVTGQDAEVTGVQRILAGEQLETVYQPLKIIASKSAEIAVPLAQGKPVPSGIAPDKTDNGAGQVPSVLVPTLSVDKSNVNDTVVKDGFLKSSDICTKSYRSACQEAGIQ
ncbi:MAG TPA: substrate-binding domain-containing protein [Baekduia sp.]|uniref:substrate-binding domain-containing protein n=1 Tax=Baekduia sp. TaxID=2600305 RepID=UPI002D780FFF|nr:substrate-binding domain-containing protein [Baekduia sp.]HET6510468.1 substrate-binding domain-containing protein [Baekduia sp.]